MGYSNSTYLSVQRALEQRRAENERQLELRRSGAYAKCPELLDIQQKLSRIGYEISRAFLDGGDIQARIDALKTESLALQAEKEDLLKQAGFPTGYLDLTYHCPHCKDKGVAGDRFCTCYKQLLMEAEKREIARIAPIGECTFESFDLTYYSREQGTNGIAPFDLAQAILTRCQRYAANFNKNAYSMIFSGATGLGKTHLSLAIANTVIQKGYSVIYGSAQNILNDLSDAQFRRGQIEPYYQEKDLLDCDLLILDDLGTEFSTTFTQSCVYNLINSRLMSHSPTLISTNFSLQQLQKQYDQRITSRLGNDYVVLQFFGNDIRQQKKSQRAKG
ncbi:MAG: ATP-binding protein [Clostridiales bacterium]|nr:ATP-binding protein [Clostridiales bacterium]